MRAEREIMEIMAIMQPHLLRICKDTDGMSFQIGMCPDGRGWAVLYELDRNVEHQHCVDFDEGAVAYNWHVNHRYTDDEINAYHREIDALAAGMEAV